mgnify:CR=1 FL=1
MRKKRLLCATLVATTLIFVGCGQQTASTEATTTPAVTSTETTTEAEEKVSYEFLRHEITTDFEGKPAIWIYSRVTNTGNESVMANCIAYPALFQNGVELEIGVPNTADMEKAEYQNSIKDIQPGTTIEIAQLYKLSDNSTITIEINNLLDWFDDVEKFNLEI